MAQQQPIQIAGRMEGNCKALIGRRNRLFPGFHGTTEQMGKFGAIKKKGRRVLFPPIATRLSHVTDPHNAPNAVHR